MCETRMDQQVAQSRRRRRRGCGRSGDDIIQLLSSREWMPSMSESTLEHRGSSMLIASVSPMLITS
jgi:signal recognition particle GTPase